MDLKFNNSIPQDTPYVHPMVNLGLEAVLVLNDSGLPIYVRNYSKSVLETGEDVVLSAFISSLSNFIKIYDKEELHGFSTASNKFFIKTKNELIYSFVLNSNIFNIAKGEELRAILDKTSTELVKSFTVYYNMTIMKDFIEKTFLNTFEKQIDILLSFNLRKTLKSRTVSNSLYKKVSIEDEFLKDSFNYAFLKFGILGLIVLDDANKPFVIRDYSINRKYNSRIDYYQKIVLTLKQFGHSKLDVLTDIGIGENRIILNEIKNFTIGVVIKEENYWNFNHQELNLLLNKLLNNIEFQLHHSAKYTSNTNEKIIKSEPNQPINYKIDQLLHSNLLEFKKFSGGQI